MRIVGIGEISVPLQGNISNALVNFSQHTVSLVAIVTDVIRDGMPLVGYAFNSIGRFSQSGIVRDRLIPRIMKAPAEAYQDPVDGTISPSLLAQTMLLNEKPGGHGDRAGAVAALELAAWDLKAKFHREPAYRTIARHFNVDIVTKDVSTYAAGGYYYPNDNVNSLRDEISKYRDLGFDEFKIKIGGTSVTRDIQRIESVLLMIGEGARLRVDANGRFGIDAALSYAAALAPFELRWYEEPGDPLDFELNRRTVEVYPGAIATGENLFSLPDALNLARYGGMRPGIDIFQMDSGLSYGLTEYAEMISMMEAHGYARREAYPHGGHLINLHIAVGLQLGGCEAYPGVFEPFGGFSPTCRVHGGTVRPSEAPGFGLEEKTELQRFITSLVD